MEDRDHDNINEEELTLTDVRKNAWHKLKGICTINKVCDGDPSRFCMGQKYGHPLGLGGVGKGLSFIANVRALDRIKLKTRLISEHAEPELHTTLYSQTLSMPVMNSSLGGCRISMGGDLTEEEFAITLLQGALDAGTVGWIGNTCDHGQELAGVRAIETVGKGIPIFKPQANQRLLDLIDLAEKAGAVAVGVDLDGVGSTNWERLGKPVFRKSMKEISELADATELPFIVKGLLSVEDTLDAVDAEVNGIDVSNHGGRALDSTRGVAEVLPEIVQAVRKTTGGSSITITAGGGIRTGFDVMKMLALGADGVLLGRDFIRAALGGGAAGVRLHFDYLASDLRRGMLLTSCNRISDIDQGIIDTPERS